VFLVCLGEATRDEMMYGENLWMPVCDGWFQSIRGPLGVVKFVPFPPR
jgi:hypothetical protein